MKPAFLFILLVTTVAEADPIRQVKIEGLVGEREKIITSTNGDFPVDAVCKCLLDAARDAEANGRLDFSADVEMTPTDPLDVTIRVRPGTAHAVGRINFSGHHRIDEITVRRMMVLQERAVFDVGRLRRSLARLNQSGLFEPLTLDDVEIWPHDDRVTVDVTIQLRERRLARWLLSGRVLPFTGSLQAAISSRLPPWGRGVFEASTYAITLNLIGIPKLLPSLSLVLERPYLPGQAWFSGFAVSPMLSVRTMITSYGLTHLGRAARAALNDEMRPGFLFCEPAKPRLFWLRRAGTLAADLALGAFVGYP